MKLDPFGAVKTVRSSLQDTSSESFSEPELVVNVMVPWP